MPDITINTYRAQKCYPEQEIPEVTIVIDEELKPFPPAMSRFEVEEFYTTEARKIVDALQSGLPQGVFDRLGIMFMERKLVLFNKREQDMVSTNLWRAGK